MTDPETDSNDSAAVAATARRAAARLSDLDATLPAFTDRLLAGHTPPRRRGIADPGTAIALASLIVSLAQIGWQVWRDLQGDLRSKGEAKRDAELREALVNALRQQAGGLGEIPAPERDRAIQTVSDEILSEILRG